MRKLKSFFLALAAICVAVAALPVVAYAVEGPETLPSLKTGETRTGTGKNVGSTEYRTSSPGLEPVVCTKAKGEGTETKSAPPEGAWHNTSEECTTKVLGVSVKCTGLGDTTAGTILLLGTWKGVWDRKKGETFKELTVALLRTNEASHFTCSSVLVEERPGEALCLLLKATEKAFTHEFHCLGEATGTNQVEEWSSTDTSPVWHVPVQLIGVNHPESFSSAIGLGLGTVTTLVQLFGDV